MRKTAAIILAGGEGKRMGILCRQTPKPALPFVGSVRVIDFSLSNCLHSQIDDMIILTDYQRSNLANYLRSWHLRHATPNGSYLSILEPRNGHYRGTAYAVYQNLEYLQCHQIETVMILAADHIYWMDYREFLAAHEQKQADVTIGVLPVSLNEARRFGTVMANSGDKITHFAEKVDSPVSNLGSMGIYAFNVKALTQRLMEDALQPDSRHDFGYSIITGMVKRDRAFAYRFNGYWRDIGTIGAYYESSMDFLHSGSIRGLAANWPVLTAGKDQFSLPEVFSNDRVHNSLVSSGCIIKGRVENSILSSGVVVEEQAVVKDSILMNNVFIAGQSQVESCIIGERANIGRSCHIGEPVRFLSQSNEITVVGENVNVPADCIINHNGVVPQNDPAIGETSVSGSSIAVAFYQ